MWDNSSTYQNELRDAIYDLADWERWLTVSVQNYSLYDFYGNCLEQICVSDQTVN